MKYLSKVDPSEGVGKSRVKEIGHCQRKAGSVGPSNRDC